MFLKSPDLAGSWYPAEEQALIEELERCQALAGEPEAAGEPVAIVAPHAGLSFSGPAAAAAYGLFAALPYAIDTFVVFGACHRERLSEPAVWVDGEWDTPLGPIAVDSDLARLFVDEGVGGDNARAHYGDNAIELQTPFIKHFFPDAKIVPVAMVFFEDSWRYGERAAELAVRRGGRVAAVASTDLTHYGRSFGVTPAGTGEAALAWTRENDSRFLEVLTRMDLEHIVPVALRDGSACGAGAAAAAAGWARARGCSSGRVLAHTNSHEVMPRGEASHIVGYAAVAFENKRGKSS